MYSNFVYFLLAKLIKLKTKTKQNKTKPRLFADDTNLTAAGESINDVEAAMNSDLIRKP
jgi:hypothetical protein